MQDHGFHLFLTLTILFSSLPSLFSAKIPLPSTSPGCDNGQIAIAIDSDLRGNLRFHSAGGCEIKNSRLKRAYIALQAWKKSIHSDPSNFTGNWDGPDVCKYNGVFCAKAPGDATMDTVASVDLNNANLAGQLPVEIGLLADMAVLHLNSNRFSGVVPRSIFKLKYIYELDLSNNLFAGPFPTFLLSLPNLKYLDLRFNGFVGELPPRLFDKQLDALFLNNNRFSSRVPDNIGNSPASVMVLSNNQFEGIIPKSIGKMTATLDEIVLSNNKFSGSLPPEVGLLGNTKLFDVENNSFSGPLPMTLNGMVNIERLNFANNHFTGFVSDKICGLPNLENFTFGGNYFNGVSKSCTSPRNGVTVDDANNCLPQRPNQKSQKGCPPVVTNPNDGNSSPSQGPQESMDPPTPSEDPKDYYREYSYSRISPTSSFSSKSTHSHSSTNP